MEAAIDLDLEHSYPTRPLAGRVIADKYRLEWPLGEGGMGVVWYATHLGLDAPVAIKLLNPGESHSTKLVDRFLHEAKAAAAVRHRNVVSTTDFGTDSDGTPFMAMELLEGTSLASRFEREGRLPISELVELMAQCLSGLAAVHTAGILHRDLKPENVFLVSDGDGVYPKVIDFGISRSLRDSPGSAGRSGRRGAVATSEGLMMGTPHYMSPEQARGETDVDQRADLYAVGVMLYEGLTGQTPYDMPNIIELLGAIARGGATPVGDLRPETPATLCAVVMRAIGPREERYRDAREMRGALLAALGTGPIAITRGELEDRPTLDAIPVRRRVATKLVVAVVCSLALVTATWATVAVYTAPHRAAPRSLGPAAAVHTQARQARQYATQPPPPASPIVVAAAPPPVVEAAPPPRRSTPTRTRRVGRTGAVTTSPAATERPAGSALVGGVFRDPGF